MKLTIEYSDGETELLLQGPPFQLVSQEDGEVWAISHSPVPDVTLAILEPDEWRKIIWEKEEDE